MSKSKLFKGIMMGVCVSLLSTSAAFAAEIGGGQSSAEGRMPLIEDKGIIEIVEASTLERKIPELNDAVLLKQKEIDQFVFVDQVNKISEMGFKVIYTAPSDKVVEIGITPYKEEFANYLYEALGKDEIVVVNSEDVMLYTTMAADNAADIPVSSEDDGRYVGDDLVLGEGEMGIVSIDLDEVDQEAADKMAESGIVENPDIRKTSFEVTNADENKENKNSPVMLVVVLAGGALLVTGGAMLTKKRVK